jgi:hypothetical protein
LGAFASKALSPNEIQLPANSALEDIGPEPLDFGPSLRGKHCHQLQTHESNGKAKLVDAVLGEKEANIKQHIGHFRRGDQFTMTQFAQLTINDRQGLRDDVSL